MKSNPIARKPKDHCGHTSGGASSEPSFPKMVHPGVRRLEEVSTDLLQGLDSTVKTRDQMVVRSLAIPFSLLRDAGNHTPRGRELLLKEFRNALAFIFSLDQTIDQDLDYIKYHVSNWFQEAVGDIRNDTGHSFPEPSPVVKAALEARKNLFSGYSNRLIRRHIFRSKKGNCKSISLLASFLLLKRGWPELSRHKMLESVKDHQKYLTMELPSISDELVESVVRVVQQVLPKGRQSYSKLNPSHKASFLHSRKQGGAYTEVVESDYQLPRARPVPALGARNLPHGGERPSLVGFTRSVGVWKDDLLKSVKSTLKEQLKDVRPAPSLGARNRPSNPNSVRVQVIPEPGKFRIITAGPAHLYTYLQGLQGFLLDQWKKQPCSTMRDGWESKVESWVAPQGWLWNSGDYKAATDQLNASSSWTCLKAVLIRLDIPHLFTGMLDSEIHYPVDVLSDGMSEVVNQRNGQLMGHPLSFPVLCMINLAGLTSACLEGQRRGILTREDAGFILAHCLINGDDILFPCPPALVPVWESKAAELGLKLSIGKSYSSEHFAMVNNVMFHMGPHGGRRLGYANQKLILNFSLKSGEDNKSPLEIGHAFNDMFKHFPLSRHFLSDCIRNRDLVSQFGFQPNFFISSKLGGLGVDPVYATGPIRVTRTHRQIAALFAEDVVSSFLWSNGLPAGKGQLKEILKYVLDKLPPPRLSTAANAERYEIRWNPLRWKNVIIESNWDSDAGSFQRWIALATSLSASLSESRDRRLSLKRLKTVNPMKRSKVLSLNPVILFPQLPIPETGFSFRY